MSELLCLHESERYGACEDEVGGIKISAYLSPIERRVGAARAVAKWNMGDHNNIVTKTETI